LIHVWRRHASQGQPQPLEELNGDDNNNPSGKQSREEENASSEFSTPKQDAEDFELEKEGPVLVPDHTEHTEHADHTEDTSAGDTCECQAGVLIGSCSDIERHAAELVCAAVHNIIPSDPNRHQSGDASPVRSAIAMVTGLLVTTSLLDRNKSPDPNGTNLFYSQQNYHHLPRGEQDVLRLDHEAISQLPRSVSDLHLTTLKSCALVGNSGALKGGGSGAMIDAHQFVVRVNQVRPYSGNNQGTFSKHSGHILGAFREHSGNTQ
jgi:hypothetical protein